MIRRAAPLLLLLRLVGCSSRKDLLKHRVGQSCVVNVRCASLGASGTQPVPVRTDLINGAQVSISGKRVSSDDRWVTLEIDGGDKIMIAPRRTFSP